MAIKNSPYLSVDPLVLDTREGYNLWSKKYDEELNILIKLEEENFLPDICGVEFSNALDLGCGTGRMSYWLHEQNPDAQITAIDFSEGMLEKAREKKKAEKITWIKSDLLKPFPVGDAKYDLIVSTLVIEHVKSFSQFFTNIRQAAGKNSSVFISGLHPSCFLVGISARFTDHETSRHILPQSFEHSISDVFNAARESGFEVVKLGEFKITEPFVERFPKAQKYLGLPLLFTIQLKG
jgi:malonyl-CoA O-methyltransferase